MVEELELLLTAVVGVEMRPVLDPVRLKPFLPRRRAHEALEIAARMQALAAPIGGGEKRHFDLRPRFVIVVIERMGADIVTELAAVPLQLFLGKDLRPAHEPAMNAAALAALA